MEVIQVSRSGAKVTKQILATTVRPCCFYKHTLCVTLLTGLEKQKLQETEDDEKRFMQTCSIR